MIIYDGEPRTEAEDDKKIAKMVWDDDKKAVIEYTKESYAKQGEIVEIDENITFEQFYKEYDPCVFQDYDQANWDYFEEQYISDWKYENDVEV